MSVNIVFRKDRKKWQVTYWVTGQRKRPLFESEREAKNFARKVELGLSPKRDSITLERAIKEYSAEISEHKSRSSKSNDKRYFNLLYHFATVERGIVALEDLKLKDLEAFQRWALVTKEIGGEPLNWSEGTVNRAFNSIRHMFKKHVQWGNLNASPCIYLDDLAAEEKERRPLTREEFELAFEKAPAWFKPVFRFMHLTGAPPSCVERFTFKDIDFSAREFILIREKGGKKTRIKLPMIEDVFELLMIQKNTFGVGPVFRNKSGLKLNADWISDVGNRAIDKAGCPDDAFLYGLRHCLASDLIDANVSTEAARQALGHADIKTTQRYAKNAKRKTIRSALELVRGGVVAG